MDRDLKELLASIGVWLIIMAMFLVLGFVFCTPTEAGMWQGIKDRREARRVEHQIDDRIDKIWRETMRKRLQEEKHLAELTKGFKNFLSKGHTKLYVVGGIAFALYLCHRGSIGCDRDSDDKRNAH